MEGPSLGDELRDSNLGVDFTCTLERSSDLCGWRFRIWRNKQRSAERLETYQEDRRTLRAMEMMAASKKAKEHGTDSFIGRSERQDFEYFTTCQVGIVGFLLQS